MGADFLFAITPYPKDWDAVRSRIEQQTPQDCLMFAEDFRGWMEDEYTEDQIVEAIMDELRTAANEMDAPYRRDCGDFAVNGKSYIISGGMSWGDEPTDAFSYIWILDWFQVTDDDRHDGGDK